MTSRASLASLSGLLAASSLASAQPEQGPAVLGAADQQRMSALVLANPEIRRIVGSADARLHFSTPEFDKAELDAFLSGSTDAPPRLQVNVLAVSATGAARARLTFENGRVVDVQPVPAAELPFFDGDVARALALAQRGERTRAALGASLSRFEPARAGQEYPPTAYIAEPLPVRSSDPRDPCSRDRCLELVFRTPTGYLPYRVQVNLTRGTATPIAPTVEHHR